MTRLFTKGSPHPVLTEKAEVRPQTNPSECTWNWTCDDLTFIYQLYELLSNSSSSLWMLKQVKTAVYVLIWKAGTPYERYKDAPAEGLPALLSPARRTHPLDLAQTWCVGNLIVKPRFSAFSLKIVGHNKRSMD
jgi:hypothetical protein